jgi:hypothetical protein
MKYEVRMKYMLLLFVFIRTSYFIFRISLQSYRISSLPLRLHYEDKNTKKRQGKYHYARMQQKHG